MENSNMYPRLNQLLPLEKIPNELEDIREALIDVFDDIFVKDLIVGKSYHGDSGFYTLTLVSDSLGINIPLAKDFLVTDLNYCPRWLTTACLLAALAVLLGAFGAHGLSRQLTDSGKPPAICGKASSSGRIAPAEY